MRQKFTVFYLQLLKKLVGSNTITIRIVNGVLKGYRWRFNNRTNNEMILGTWEPEMQDIFTRYIKPGHTIYDLGAHQGFLTAMAGKLTGGAGKVYSFEPFPSNYRFLSENIHVNNLKNIKLFQAAVSDKSGKIAFSNSIHDTANTYLQQSPTFDDNKLEVNAVTLDALIEAKEITPPDFIKIDVEGAELDVLKGAEKLFLMHKPVVYLETHNVHNPGVDEQCLRWLEGKGYHIAETIAIKPNREMCSYVLLPKK